MRRRTPRPRRARYAVLAAVVVVSGCTDPTVEREQAESPTASPTVVAGYDYLLASLDACPAPIGARLATSYRSGPPAQESPTTAYMYDQAMAIIALTDGRAEDLAAAHELANAIVTLQRKDPAGDGRLRNAYDCTAPAEDAHALTDASSTGNMAWAALALTTVYEATGDESLLDAATRIGVWIDATTSADPGFTGGIDGDGEAISWKSTEHNIDVAALFERLAQHSTDPRWADGAASARSFIDRMWDDTGHYWIGSGTDGTTPNTDDYVPADVQSWAALLDPPGRDALPWMFGNLTAADGNIEGIRVGDGPDDGTVWFEGTAQAALALQCRGEDGDDDQAARLRATIARSPSPLGGIDAASRTGTAGGDSTIYPAQHLGTTAWYLLANSGRNPFTGRTC